MVVFGHLLMFFAGYLWAVGLLTRVEFPWTNGIACFLMGFAGAILCDYGHAKRQERERD